MPGISEILQVVMLITVMLLISLGLFSGKIFTGRRNIFFVLTSAGIIFFSFIALEETLQIYLVKFYLYLGWSAVILYLLVFFIVFSPLVLMLFKMLFKLRTPVSVSPTIIAKPEPAKPKIVEPEFIKPDVVEIVNPEPVKPEAVQSPTCSISSAT
jgi:hypothetical protein